MGHYSIAFVGQHMSSSSYLLYRERKKTVINTKKWCEELLFEGNLGTSKRVIFIEYTGSTFHLRQKL